MKELRGGVFETSFLAQGRSLDACERYVKLCEEASDRRIAFATEMGIERPTGAFFRGDDVIGLARLKPVPEGWRIDKKHGYMVPNRRTEAGREAARRLKECSFPSRVRFWRKASPYQAFADDDCGCSNDYVFSNDRRLFVRSDIYTAGEHFIIVVRHLKDEEPPCPIDAKRLKESELWALKERVEEANLA